MSVVLAVVLHALYLYAYIQIGQFLPVASEGSFHLLSVEGNVERIGAVGIVTAAGLAGIGAVFTPFEWIAALRWCVRMSQGEPTTPHRRQGSSMSCHVMSGTCGVMTYENTEVDVELSWTSWSSVTRSQQNMARRCWTSANRIFPNQPPQ